MNEILLFEAVEAAGIGGPHADGLVGPMQGYIREERKAGVLEGGILEEICGYRWISGGETGWWKHRAHVRYF